MGFDLIIIGQLLEAKTYTLSAIEFGNLTNANMNLGHIYMCEQNESLAIDTYLIAIAHFEDKNEFWTGFDDDYQYLIQYGVDADYYQSIKQILKERVGA